jgi:hypothetical protein
MNHTYCLEYEKLNWEKPFIQKSCVSIYRTINEWRIYISLTWDTKKNKEIQKKIVDEFSRKNVSIVDLTEDIGIDHNTVLCLDSITVSFLNESTLQTIRDEQIRFFINTHLSELFSTLGDENNEKSL